MLRILLGICAIGFSIEYGLAQKPLYEPTTFVGEGDSIFWNRAIPVYLKMSSSVDDSGVLLKTKNQEQYSNPIYFEAEGVNYIRTKLLVEGKSQEVLFPVFVDGKPPTSRAEFLGAVTHIRAGTKYIGKGLTIELTSTDAVSGLSGINYAINNENYSKYTGNLSFEQNGYYHLKFYGVDRVGNAEIINEQKFILDFLPPSSVHNIEGASVNSAYSFGTKLSFVSSDSLAGVHSIYYKLDDNDFRKYNNSIINIDYLEDGDHVLTYYATDHVENKESIKEFKFFFDRTPPLLATDILGDRFIVGNEIYFSGRTKLKFTAVDNKVGVKEVKYSINDGPYKIYDQPFYLPSASGTHSVQYYAVDNLLNKTSDKKTATGIHEFEHKTTKVYVDLVGPNLSHSVIGKSLNTRDTLFVNKETKILLEAHDEESGMQKITYSLEGSPEEFDYQKALSLTKEGYHAIDFYGYDNVNNRNLSHLNVYLDNRGPEIFHFFSSDPYSISEDSLSVYSNEVSIYLAATDDHVGLQSITYQIDDGIELYYGEKIKSLEKNKKHKLKIKATDVLGNITIKHVAFYCGKR